MQTAARDEAVAALPNALASAIDLHLSTLPAGLQIQLLTCLASGLKRCEDAGFTMGTACSGSDIIVKVMGMLHVVLSQQHGFKVDVSHIMSVEIDKHRRMFLLT